MPYSGAGINVAGASPTIRDCTIQNCDAMEGAGVYAYESNMLLENCQISQCTAAITGGGILMLGESVFREIRSCTISYNRANAGGGIYISTTHETELAENAILPVISNCMISGNSATGSEAGGGIEIGTGCRYLGPGNTITENSPYDEFYHDYSI